MLNPSNAKTPGQQRQARVNPSNNRKPSGNLSEKSPALRRRKNKLHRTPNRFHELAGKAGGTGSFEAGPRIPEVGGLNGSRKRFSKTTISLSARSSQRWKQSFFMKIRISNN